ncbi:Eco57I restriction-modification methylase domain-containing protein [Helicobacter pylori]|uniref:helicase-related protein n=1 Tax=Helicobacter pylori TaxID=210 RepID=UPI001F0E930B|nr:helicase-related protein [Helicobacter pylori]MCH4611118.1 Eco57I restriction-modification methylase domain-containing protein [Helicobacter pylori]
MQKKKAKNPQPNLFSILDNGNIATNNPIEESDKANEIQDPLPYVVKTQINKASMISRNPIEWAKYLSFEKRVYNDNSKEDVNFFANGEIKESSRVYEANKEGFERRITKRYDLIDTIRNREFFPREIEILTHTNSLEELKEQGLEIQLTHHNETHKKTLENGNEIVKEYDYLKDIYQEVERTQDGELVREIIPSISSAECFKLYNKLPFESINNENTKLNTNDNEEVKKLEFELAKEVHALILEQQLLSATNYYSWIDKDDYASFAWKMHRLINENKLKENHLSADNANKIKQFFFNNGFILGWTKEEQSAIQENRDYSLRSDLLSLEEIAQAKIELQKYYESVYVNGDGNQREIKPFKEILRDINNFEKAYKERYDKLVSLNEAIIQAKEGSNERQNSSANDNNPIKNTIEANTSNNIIQNNDNNHPNLSVADLELEKQNLGEPNGKERTNRADEPSRARAGIPQEIHRRSEPRGQQEGVERSSDEDLSHQDPSLFIEPREQGGTRGIYRSSDQQAVSEKPHRERDRIHEHVSRRDGVSARADSNGASNGASSPASRMENGTRSEEKRDNPSDERGVSRPPKSPSHQQNSSKDLGLSLFGEQPGQTGRLRLFDHGQMGSLFPTDHENQRSQNNNELDKSSDRANENGDKSPRQSGSANQESARGERHGIAPGSSDQSVLPLAQSRLYHAGLGTPNGLGDLEENRDQERRLFSNLDNLESLLNAIRNNTIASEPDFRSRLLEAIQNNEPLKDSLVGAQLLKDPTTKVFYDKFQLRISPKKVLEILENRLKKSIETTNETLNAFNVLDSQAIDLNAISNSIGLNPTQESKITNNSVELNNAQEQTAQEQDMQENAPTTIKQETPTAPAIPLNPKIDFKPSEEVLIKGAKTRYKANIKAIELLKELQAKQEILKGDYYATQEEQEILAQFSGWGGLESYFKKAQHPKEFKELNALLTKDEFRRAYLSARDAYYTPKLVIDSIYQALDQLGFNNDNYQKEIFEPSLGTGKFIAHAPSDKNYRFMGTELDPISANISKFLYPNQVIQNTALEKHQFYQEYDAFVGNPPYGNHKIYSFYDKELSNESVHNYFLGKAIKELKDDGIGAFVVSSWFMDAKNPKMREHIAKNATFLGAIRLPNSVFKGTGAEVTSDIVFFKKGVEKATNQSFTKAMPYYDKIIDSLDDDTLFALQNNHFDSFIPSDQLKIVNAIASHFGLKQEKLQRWYEKIDTTNFGYKEQDYKIIKDFMDKVGENNIHLNEQTLNEYFINHPENILGHLSLEKTRYSFEINGEQIYKYELQALEDKSLDLSQALNQAIEKLPKDVYQYHKTTLKTDALIIDANNERYQEVHKLIKNLERGELVKWDNLYFKLEQNNEMGIFLKPTKINSKVQDSRLKAYFKIKDALNDLTSAELNPLSSDLELESKRSKLNLVYDEFVKKFGYLNENKNRKDIKQDLYGAKVLGLEKDFEKEITPRSAKMQNIEPRQAQAKKAQIFFERTLNPKKELIITNSKEALIASINQKGCLDLHFIRDHFKTQSLETTIKELLEQKLIYKDHKDNGGYILANDYLSGNVKRKLKEVKEAINQGVEGLEINLKDLERIIPKDLKATEIMANINSPWIPTQYLEEFLIELAANHYEKQYGDKMTDYQLGNLKEDIKVEHLSGAYEVFARNNELNELYGIRHKDKAHSYKAPFESLLNKVLNNKDLSVKYAQVDPNDPKKEIFITDEEQSNLARQKAEELKEAFKDWVYKDYTRRTHLEQIYGDKPINVVVKRSEEVAQFIGVADENGKYNEGSIIDRMQKCEGKKSKKGQDNILSCTTDARKVALDYRLIDPNAKVEKEFSKSYAMAKNIYENYLETHATKGTQLGFIGLSTPKTHSQKVSLEVLDNAHEIENKNPLDEAQELLESLSSYDENGNLIAPSKKELENELKEKEAKSVNLDEELAKGCSFDVYSDVLRHLVKMGIPQNEIAFIHDAKTEEQKQDLFKKLNRGKVRVLLGSPAKMGVGTNVQERLVAMHELDCPWRPDELLQMEGRGIRQGNILHQNDPENFRMKIYRYATEKTYDSRMWQIIETKSKGIEQFRNAHKLGLNELEDFNMGSSNASEMKAEATGNPLIIEEVKLRAEIKNEEAKYKAFNKEHYFNEENLKNNSSQWDHLKQELKDLETLQGSVMIPTHTEIKIYDLKNEESKDYELIKVKEVEPLKENASMSEELTHKKLKEQNKQIAEQNKEKLDAIKKQFASNLNDLFFNEEIDCKLLEYKGFVVNAYKTKYQVEFSLSPKDNPNVAYSPSNMVYKNDTSQLFSSYNFCAEIKFDGFLKRLDNAITKLPEKIKELENSIETTQENIAKYTRLVEQKPSYPRLEYLQALKWDHKTLIDDLAKMSKDRDYKPAFNPKSKEVLEKMNAEKRASLVDESVTEEIKEQAKQEAYKPMKKAASDDYDMGM